MQNNRAALQLTFLTGFTADNEPITKKTTLNNANEQLSNEQFSQVGNAMASLIEQPIVDMTLVRYHSLTIDPSN